MIRIDRGDEPDGWAITRETEIARVRPHFASGAFDRKILRERYKEQRETLWRRQHRKCCYCERICEDAGEDLEHFRPASLYWWLAWTWSNLLFACKNCNRWAKNDAFPLDPPGVRLQVDEQPEGGEHPVVVNPALEDPMDFIQFVPDESSGRWLPRPRGANPRGAETIRILKLDRQAVLEVVQNHVDKVLSHGLCHLRQLMTSGDEKAVRDYWQVLLLQNVQRGSYYAALNHDVLDHFFPAAERAHWGLELHRP